jgi:hypothetical protein
MAAVAGVLGELASANSELQRQLREVKAADEAELERCADRGAQARAGSPIGAGMHADII